MSVAASSNEDAEAEALRRAQRAHEPSMEEILASIRAIIADDREPAAPKPGPQIVYSSDAGRGASTPRPPRRPRPPPRSRRRRPWSWTRDAEAPRSPEPSGRGRGTSR